MDRWMDGRNDAVSWHSISLLELAVSEEAVSRERESFA